MKKKTFTLILLLGFLIPSTFGQNLNFDWGMGFTNINNQYLGLEIDASKNIITYSTFYNTLDLDPSAGTANIVSTGSIDVFFAKYDPNRNLIWKRSFGALNNEMIEDVETDSDLNIYITGQFQDGPVDFNPAVPGTTVVTASGTLKYDIFIAKYNPNGELIWLKTLQNPSEDENAWNLELDNANNVYISGYFKGTLDFDPSASTTNLTSLTGNKDIFVAKYDTDGNFSWVRQFTGSTYYELSGMVVDHQNNVIVTNVFTDNVNFNPTGAGGSFSSMGHNPTAITKFNSSGAYQWTKILDGPTTDAYVDVNGLVVDEANNIYFSAYYEGNTDFDPTGNTAYVPAIVGNGCSLFAKYDPNGNYIFAKMLGAGGAGAIDVDVNNNIYVAGGFYNTIDFDFSANVADRTSVGMSDVYIVKYDQNLSLLSLFATGGALNDSFIGLTVDGTNEIYVYGYNNNTGVDYDPSANNQSFTHESSGPAYTYWLKYSQCTNATLTETKSACGSYTWRNGTTYTASNNTATFTVSGVAANGCDSVYTLNLTINPIATLTETKSACGTYTWRNGTTYTASNNTATYTVTGVAANGCDSVYTLNLTINPIATFTETKSACGSYTWRNGTTYTASNNTATYTVTGVAAGGCDSVYTLNLTINSVNISTSLSNATITSNETGANYRWLDCNNNMQAIVGANNQSYTPIQNGSYAVEITKNACTDTSACVVISTLGLNENTLANAIIYPNPFIDQFTLQFNELIQKGQVTIYDQLSQKVKGIDFEQKTDLDIQINTESGIYFVEISNEKGVKHIFKVVKH